MTSAFRGRAGDLLNLSYNYTIPNTTNNNGNLQSQTITRGSQSWSQNYTYDGVNRLLSAGESGSWNQNYSYTASGNRAVSGYIPNSGWTPQSLSAYNSNNQWSGATYDAAGNQKGLASESFTYDVEQRLNAASVSGISSPVTYSYDGDGRRVSKTIGSNVTTYVYDAAGQLAAEYDTTAPNVTGTVYLTADNLGSTRLVTSGANWAPLQCYDYLPFGEEIPAGTDGRSSCFSSGTYPVNPSADALTQKFTGKERDGETGLDWFETRYSSAPQGRFTSPDLPFSDQFPWDPQGWNLYAYARNNPLRYNDPDGQAHRDPNGFWVGDVNGECQQLSGKTVCWNAKSQQWEAPPKISALDLPGQWFAGFVDLFINDKRSGAARMLYAYAANVVAGTAIETGVRVAGATAGGALEAASSAAFKAAENAENFQVPLKHLATAAGRWAKFASDVNVQEAVEEALTSPNATLRPNGNDPNSFVVITDLGRQIGTKGQTALRVVVGNDGKIWTAYPVNTK